MAMILRTSKCDNKVARQLDDEVVWHEEARCKGDVVTLRQRAGEGTSIEEQPPAILVASLPLAAASRRRIEEKNKG
uniref:Uncharacterized protein n=1 Tax=Oryza sativa subsp. japonica TaxID=39947 RepID=Q5Z7F7_ORYSJ|nr:hypothetical protein [Oryza sativa Japonica Group]BAD54157.1 hypothetical protein [Oryza sativa Japonica Group]